MTKRFGMLFGRKCKKTNIQRRKPVEYSDEFPTFIVYFRIHGGSYSPRNLEEITEGKAENRNFSRSAYDPI